MAQFICRNDMLMFDNDAIFAGTMLAFYALAAVVLWIVYLIRKH